MAKSILNLNIRAIRQLVSDRSLPFNGLFWKQLPVAAVNSMLGAVQSAKISELSFAQKPPVFVLGHWRSGTTYLHELLSLDPSWSTPNTYECFHPSHFLLTEKEYFRSAAPENSLSIEMRRPMDDMKVTMNSPQEEEFAMLALGARSPYLWLLLPNAYQSFLASLDVSNWSERDCRDWALIYRRFLAGVNLKRPGRLLLKSPTNTFRIALLNRLFPGSLFIHITRNPDYVFQSTTRLWENMFQLYGYEERRDYDFTDVILRAGNIMLATLKRDLPTIATGQYLRVKYEDLVSTPIALLEHIHASFSLSVDQAYWGRVSEYLNATRSYRPLNELPSTRDLSIVRKRWLDHYEYFSY